MKRKLAVLLVLMLAFTLPAMAASVDLSGMSFDELVALRKEIDKALVKCDEWQEVTVPVGVYTVGVDIPAGHWSIAAGEKEWPTVIWAEKLDASGRSADYSDILHRESMMGAGHRSYEEYGTQYPPKVDLKLEDGQYIIIEDGNVVFSPFTGGVGLGFK